eukprot:1158299-Pelagomonas_calceolata.AAC.8
MLDKSTEPSWAAHFGKFGTCREPNCCSTLHPPDLPRRTCFLKAHNSRRRQRALTWSIPSLPNRLLSGAQGHTGRHPSLTKTVTSHSPVHAIRKDILSGHPEVLCDGHDVFAEPPADHVHRHASFL